MFFHSGKRSQWDLESRDTCWQLTTTTLFLLLWICLVFRDVWIEVFFSIARMSPLLTALQPTDFQPSLPWDHLPFFTRSLGKPEVKHGVVDTEHCVLAGGEEAVLLSDWDVLGAYKWAPAGIAAVTRDVISLLLCWPPLPKISHQAWENWQKKTCARASAASVQIQLLHGSLAQEFKPRGWALQSWRVCMSFLL